MTERPSGWYWIKDDPTDDWQVAEWDIDGGYLWIIDGASRRADPDIIGPRIGSPDEMTSEDAIAASVAGAQAEKRHLLLAEQQTMDKALRKSMKIIHEGRAQGGQEPSAEAWKASGDIPRTDGLCPPFAATRRDVALAIDAFAASKVTEEQQRIIEQLNKIFSLSYAEALAMQLGIRNNT